MRLIETITTKYQDEETGKIIHLVWKHVWSNGPLRRKDLLIALLMPEDSTVVEYPAPDYQYIIAGWWG